MGVVKRQGIKNTISSYLGIIIGFVSLIIIQPKLLPPEIIGLSRVLFAFSTLVGTLIPLGAANIAIKYFPKFFNPEEKHHGFWGFLLIFPMVGGTITFLFLYFFKDDIIAKYSLQSPLFASYFYLVFPFCIFLGLTSLFNSYLSSIYKSTIPAYLSDIFVRLLYVICIFLFHYNIFNVSEFIFSYVAIYAIQVIALIIYIYIEGHPSYKISWDKVKSENHKEMIQFGLIISIASFASMGLNTIDAVILGSYGLNTLGIYTVVAFIPTIIQTPLNALDRISASKIAFALHENDTTEIRTIYYKSCKYLFVIGCYLTVMINTNIASLLSMIKPEYLVAMPIVPIVSIGYLFNMAGGTNTTLLFYSGKKHESAFLLIGVFIITIVMDIILIPKYGMLGAAYAIMITAIIYTLIKWWIIKTKFNLQPYDISFVRIAFTAIIAYLSQVCLPQTSHPIFDILLKGTIGTIIFTAGILFQKIIILRLKDGKIVID